MRSSCRRIFIGGEGLDYGCHVIDGTWQTDWGERTSPALLRLPGYERAVLGRDRDPRSQWPPYALFGFRPSEVAPGAVTGSMPVTDWLLDSRGELGFPLLAFVADAPTAVCVSTRLPPGEFPVTVGLRLEMMNRPALDESTLRCAAEQELREEQYALSSGRLEGSQGTVQALARARLMIQTVEVARLPELPSPPARDETDLPFSRAPSGEPVPAEDWARRSPLEVIVDQIEGRLPLPPLSHLTGMRSTQVAEGEAWVVLPAAHWLDRPVFGGALALLAATAIETAGDTAMEAGWRATLLDFACNYLRPGVDDGLDFEAHARTTHAGQRVRVVDCEVVQDGKVLITARGTLAVTALG